MNTFIVSSEWLHQNLTDNSIIVLDASQKTNINDTCSNLEKVKIKGAIEFDLKNNFSDPTSPFPNMIPTPKQFEGECRKLGIKKNSKIIVYDNLGVYFSPRVWWMFKIMGHQEVYVLDGGLPEWKKNGFNTERKEFQKVKRSGDFTSKFNFDLIKEQAFINLNIKTKKQILIDARSYNRFHGLEPEPRIGLKNGHIPYAINIPFQIVLNNGKFKSKKELAEIFPTKNIGNKPLIFSCGSGVTACIVLLACKMVLENKTSLYDGSWAEWASTNN